MTTTESRYTKHYYAGSRRILSKNGAGNFNNMMRPGVAGITAGGVNYLDRAAQLEKGKTDYYKELGIPPGPPHMKGVYGQPEQTGTGFPDSGTPTASAPRGWPRKPIFNPPGGPPGPPIQWGDDITNETVEPGFGYVGTGAKPEYDQYFYHPDHLGSTAYVTNVSGEVCQFFVYLPYGETLVDKHTGTYKVPYTFSAKEKDAETGLTYFEARYYDSKYTTFLSVDPLWMKSPGVSVYAYCVNNPLIYVDPTGLFETRAQAKQYKKEHGINGDIRKDKDGIFSINDWNNGVSYFRDKSLEGNSNVIGMGEDGVISSTLITQNDGGTDALFMLGMSMNAAGWLAGAGEYSNVIDRSWKGINGKWNSTSWGGNQWTGTRAKALSRAKAFKFAGRGCFYIGGVVSISQGYEAYQRGDNAGIVKAGIDIGMGAVATFGGPPGWIIGGGYFILDAAGAFDNHSLNYRYQPPPYALPDNTYVKRPIIIP